MYWMCVGKASGFSLPTIFSYDEKQRENWLSCSFVVGYFIPVCVVIVVWIATFIYLCKCTNLREQNAQLLCTIMTRVEALGNSFVNSFHLFTLMALWVSSFSFVLTLAGNHLIVNVFTTLKFGLSLQFCLFGSKSIQLFVSKVLVRLLCLWIIKISTVVSETAFTIYLIKYESGNRKTVCLTELTDLYCDWYKERCSCFGIFRPTRK